LALVAGGGDGFELMTTVTVSVSLAALLAGLMSLVPAGGATATMLVSEPVALGVTAPLSSPKTSNVRRVQSLCQFELMPV